MGLFDLFRKKPVNVEPVVDYEPIPIRDLGDLAPDCYAYRGSVEKYFFEVISFAFPQLTIKRNQKLGPKGSAPVTFLLCRGDKPVLAIILCHKYDFATDYVERTVQACSRQRIPVQCYYEQFRNKAEYVIRRIRAGLS